MSSKEERVARQSIGSTFIVTFGNIVYAVVLAITSLIIARLLGPAAYGVYGLVLAIPLFLQLLAGVGVQPASTRYSSYYISRGNITNARRMTKNAILFSTLTGLVLTFLSVIFSGSMSSTFLHRPEITLYVELASISIIGQVLFNFQTGAFVSWGIPTQYAVWNTIQAVLKLIVSVLLVLLGLGVLGALWGFDISYLLGGSFGIIALYVMKLRNHTDSEKTGLRAMTWSLGIFAKDVSEMVRYGLPDYAGYIILMFSQQPILIIILSIIASNTIIGYYSAATNIASGLTLIVGSLAPVFFATFARLDGMKSDTGNAFSYAVKYISYFLIPVFIFLMASSNLVIEIIYGRTYLPASYYLELLMLGYLPLAFGQAVLSSFFNGVGKTRLTMYMALIESLATLAPAFILIIWLKLGVNGLLYSIIISNIAPTVFGLYIADKYLRARADYINLLKILVISIICYGFVYLLASFVFTDVSNFVLALASFLVELLVFLGLYLTLVPLFRAIGSEDISRLKTTSHGQRVLSRFLHPILNYENFLIEHIEKIST
ncbi:MAG: oligosaccharide flippase family protein [archaeon]|nr:oligosaccharide flippase family protein [archaeon]